MQNLTYPAPRETARYQKSALVVGAVFLAIFIVGAFMPPTMGGGLDQFFHSYLVGFVFWLGVSMYLTEAAVDATLAEVAAWPGGGEIVFDYSEPPHDAMSEQGRAARETLRDNIAASLACHAAIKVDMTLSPEKMRWLIDRLLKTSSPTTCPHGRPVILRLATRDILKGFHRI